MSRTVSVLLITRDSVVLDIVRSVLKTCRVICSDDSHAELALGSCRPDIVFVDFVCVDKRVEKERIRLLRRIIEEYPSTPVVLLGPRGDNFVRAAELGGFVSHLPEVTRGAILREVCKYLGEVCVRDREG